MSISSLKNKKGFALIELIIAIGIFLGVISIGLGAMVNLYNANNKSESLASVINNLNYAIESMTRDIRFATVYHCGSTGTLTTIQNCDSGNTFLAISTSSSPIIYRFLVVLGKGRIERSDDSGVSYKPVTGGEINIQYAKFYVLHTAPPPSDLFQPYVILFIKGYAGSKPSAQSSFEIQTMISQRALNI